MSTTLFSIITPSLNQLDWLRLCVASVKDQLPATGPAPFHIEHIIQDGGSPGIVEFARETGAEFFTETGAPAPSHPAANSANEPAPLPYRLVIHSEPDVGMYDAINRGLRRASGNLCACLNSDEQYLPQTLSKVLQEFSSRPRTTVLFGDAILLDGNCQPLSYRQILLPRRWHLRLCHLSVFTCSTFFRRSIIDDGLLFDPRWKIIGDAVWIDSLLARRIPMERIPAPLSLFAWTPTNLSETDLARGQDRESEQWISGTKFPPRWLRLPLVLKHRIEKLFAGAYRTRVLNIARYTPQSPSLRQHSGPLRLKTGWPGQTMPKPAVRSET